MLHDPHGDCDGRTPNEPMVGQLLVEELRAALADEQDRALVTARIDGNVYVLRLATDRPKGLPVFVLDRWEPS